MKKALFSLFLIFFFNGFIHAQVGVNTVTPNALLDIKSSNQTTPANTDGILIPKIDAFPLINPTLAQKGMLVYLTTLSGGNQPGFYYWNNPGWIGIVAGSSGGSLDQAYDFGGAGLGKTITADAGAVLINGTDGLVSTGTAGSGAVMPTGAGTRMVWNPRKGAFRVGSVSGTQWDDINVGDSSTAFGFDTSASGLQSTSFGSQTIASGVNSTAFGFATSAIGSISTAFGIGSIASGDFSTAFGNTTTASGQNSTSFGRNNTAPSYAETILGIGATTYTTTANGATQFRTANATDRLLVVGNAIDLNNNNNVDPAERSVALVILKNGNTGIGTSVPLDKLHILGKIRIDDGNQAAGKILVSDASGTATWTTPTTNGGTLDNAYDFGGAGFGKTITADAGAVLINGTDGLVATGTLNSGDVMLSGPGTKMVWNPRKAAFRAGNVTGGEWDDSNVGIFSTAFGSTTRASGFRSTALGFESTASGTESTAFGFQTIASGVTSTAMGNTATASGINSTAFGNSTIASADSATAFGNDTTASGTSATAFGNTTFAFGDNSTALGKENSALSYAETVLGVGATIYATSPNGALEFSPSNATDRLLVVGNAIDTNFNDVVDFAERSDALVILKNGNTGIGSSTPQDKLHIVGKIRMVDGNQATGRILVSDANGTATWTTPATNGGTLDQAYDFGGAGLGKTITADAGAVLIDGTDGLVSTGTSGSGAIAPAGAGTRMVWNPNKAAFRAGNISGTQWDDANVGVFSVAFGIGTRASGGTSTAFGRSTVASADESTAFGFGSVASAQRSTAFGILTTASGDSSTAFGGSSLASGSHSTAFGQSSVASGFIATAFGRDAIASGDVSTAFGNSTDAIGNKSTAFGEFSLASGANSTAFGLVCQANGESSTAFGRGTIASGQNSTSFGRDNTASSYGETALGIGATTYVASINGATQFRTANATDRLLMVGNAVDANNNNLVDAAERSDALVILKNGNTGIGSSTPQDKLHVVGKIRMVDGNQAVGKVFTSDANGTATWTTPTASGGTLDQAYDFGGSGLGKIITADAGAVLINGTDGMVSTGTFGSGAVMPTGAGTKMVWNPRKAAFRAGTVSGTQWDDANVGDNSIASGNTTIASGNSSTAFGQVTIASGSVSTAFGSLTSASGNVSTAFGLQTTASANTSTAFGFNTTANSINATAFGASTNANGFTSTAFGLTNTASSYGETALGIGATNYTTTINGNINFRTANATDRLLVVGNAIDTNNNNNVDAAERSDALVILKNGNTGIGISTPQRKLHVATGLSGVTPFAGAPFVVESSGDAYQHFLTPNTLAATGAGLLFGTPAGAIRGGIVYSALAENLDFRTGGNTVRMTLTNAGDFGIGTPTPGGQLELSLNEGRKPGTNTWTIVSDQRLKTLNGDYTKGLNEILQLKPIRFNYKNSGSRTFEKEVLDTEFAGFLAQEVQPLFPEAVGTDDDGFLNFNIHPILIASVNALKELNAKNEQLEQKSSQLEKENQSLKESVQAINDKMVLIIAEMEKLKK